MAEFVIITGMSGAGRSTAANTFEDLGWFTIDNLPISLAPKVVELVETPGGTVGKVALVLGRNVADDVGQNRVAPAIEALRAGGSRVRVLFLDASDEVLIRRYEGTRRRHPLAEAETPAVGISRERALLEPLKAQADVVIDSGDLNVHQLRERIVSMFGSTDGSVEMAISVVSFGFKHGLPTDVDLVFDLRFLPNPHWVDELRPYTGLDAPVRDYVLGNPVTQEFLSKLDDLLAMLLPAYVKEGKAYLSIAVGCTGGQHRSVAIAEELGRRLALLEYPPMIRHRDLHKR
jgi:RNase adapter protein RapZ